MSENNININSRHYATSNTTLPDTSKRCRSSKASDTKIDPNGSTSPPAKRLRSAGILLISPPITASNTSALDVTITPRRSLRLNPQQDPTYLVSPPDIHENISASPIGSRADDDSDFTPDIKDKPALKETKTQTPKTLKDDLLAEIKNQGLPEGIFTSPNVDWIEMLIERSTAAPDTVQDIQEFVIRISQTTYPKSSEDPVAFITDKDRTNWHSHCPEVDAVWGPYVAKAKEIIGETQAYNTASMAKTSGALGPYQAQSDAPN